MTDSWDKKKELTKLVFGPILTPPLGELIAEGDRLKEKADKWGKTLSELGVSYEAEGEWWFDPEKWNKLKKKADILDFLFGEKGVRTENLMKLQIWREKAEKYDGEHKAAMIVEEELRKIDKKLETVKNYCLNTLGTTEDFPNWMKPIRDEMKHILKILEAEQ